MFQVILCVNLSAEMGIIVPKEIADSTIASNNMNEGSHNETAQIIIQII